VGELELSYNRLELLADAGLTIVSYTPEPGSRSGAAFALLASSKDPANQQVRQGR
jgi:hypothetical protein